MKIASSLIAALLCVAGSSAQTLTPVEKAVVRLSNAARAGVGKPALKPDAALMKIARGHAVMMARLRKMAHALAGKGPGGRAKAAGYKFRALAENVAFGYPSPAAAVRGWLQSPGHRQNLLDETGKGYVEIGVGVARASDGQIYYCQVFGRPSGGKPAGPRPAEAGGRAAIKVHNLTGAAVTYELSRGGGAYREFTVRAGGWYRHSTRADPPRFRARLKGGEPRGLSPGKEYAFRGDGTPTLVEK